MWGAGGGKSRESESEEESSEEESSEDEAAGPSSKAPKAELTREELKAQKKAKKEAAIARAKAAAVQVGDLPPSDSEEESEDDAPMPANPNHSKSARNQTKKPVAKEESDDEAVANRAKKLSIADSAPGNRKEREAAAAAAAKERYQKLHEAGKTDQAKADLARLKLIREKREQEAARKQVCGIFVIAPTSYIIRTGLVANSLRF